MTILVVYYSFDGNTKYAAQRIADRLGADLLELKAENEPPRNALKFLVGGKSVLMGEKALLHRFKEDPSAYDVIVLGTPVWAGRVTPAIREFALSHPFEGKKVGIFACSAGGDAESVFGQMRNLLGGNEICATLSLKNPLKNRSKADQEADAFCVEMEKQIFLPLSVDSDKETRV